MNILALYKMPFLRMLTNIHRNLNDFHDSRKQLVIFPTHTSCDYDTWSFTHAHTHARTHTRTHAYVKLDPVQTLSQTQRCVAMQSEICLFPSAKCHSYCPLSTQVKQPCQHHRYIGQFCYLQKSIGSNSLLKML